MRANLSFYIVRHGQRLVNTLLKRGVVLEQTDMHQEAERLTSVLAEVRAQRLQAQRDFDGVREDMVQARQDFWEEFRFKPDDIWETVSTVLQQNKMLSEGERRYRHAAQSLRNLDRLERSPYFGRVDFLEPEQGAPERIYIGVATLRTPEDDFLVYDWRTPIASLYYDHGPGPASYLSPMGDVSGEMLLKRQFVISEGQIRLMFDTGVTIGDELLMEALSGHADAEMHSIVATIQREQNKVIRDDAHRLLVVLGVAGSGKTSAALQRVAYLLYRHRETLQRNQMVLFSPNALFNSYVAAVLPELGEEPIHQTTFQSYIDRRIGGTMEVEDAYDQIERLLATRNPEERRVRLEGIRFKSSLAFKEILDRYAVRLRSEGMIFSPARFRGREIVSAGKLEARFKAFGPNVPASTRSNLLRDWLLERLRSFERQASREDWVLDEMQLLGAEELQEAELHRGGRRASAEVDQLDASRAHLGRKIAHQNLQAARDWVDQRQFVDLSALYLRIFRDPAFAVELGAPGSLPDAWPEICRETAARLEQGVLSYEDATPFLYLDELVRGFQVNRSVRHVFVDEAQDYSPFQLAVLRHLFPSASMTLLGDPNQSVSAAPSALAQPATLTAHYAPGAAEIVELRQSYRSTREIVEFTRGLLPGGEEIIPFDRRGEKPRLIAVPDRADLPARIADDVASLQRDGQQTIAVICRTAQEAEEAHKGLAARLPAQLIRKGASVFHRGVLVLPGYLAKGLEFDSVVLFDVSDSTYGSLAERGLLYTACTRAMHHLHLYTAGSSSPILAAADPATYTVVH